METSGNEFNEMSRYFEASAADLVRDEFSNKPRNTNLGIDVTNANPMSLFRLLNMQARRNQQEIRNSFIEGG